MSVYCANCHTGNRDGAMFCRGCTGKLPAFAATGPSALQLMKERQPARPAPAAPSVQPDAFPIETRAFWMRVAVAILAVVVGFGAWYGYVTRKVPSSTKEVASAAGPIATATAASSRRAGAVVSAKTPELLPLESSLARGEEAVALTAPAANAPTTPSPTPSAPPETVARLTEPERPAVARAPRPLRIAKADPRESCAGLSYMFAARCEAANCARPAYMHHPRCDIVRADRRRDEARRNPTLGY